jgi:hypothetical protein
MLSASFGFRGFPQSEEISVLKPESRLDGVTRESATIQKENARLNKNHNHKPKIKHET